MTSVSLVSVTPDAEKLLAHMARVSSSNPENPEYSKLLRYLIDHKHWSPFEMVDMSVEIETSRGISPQILRHKSFSFQEFSQRYALVDESGVEIYALRRQDRKNRQNSIDDMPEEWKREFEQDQLDNWKRAFGYYMKWINRESAKEVCRFFLPLGAKTQLYMKGSVRSWIHYLQLRTQPDTQLEHREIAEQIRHLFIENFPETSKALGWGWESVVASNDEDRTNPEEGD